MNKKLYVGNLSFTTTEEQLRDLFEQHGRTQSVNVISDRETGRSRGFGFVEFEDAESARAAQEALDGKEFDGRPLRVNEAQERRPGGGGGGGGGRGGGGGGYGGRRGR
ncbi:MAG: RNA-binding protein [Myxococcales bacterium]|nr:RNA-binding protein [Myxococcales bacterium]MDH5566049.1 RNA-binding protein [Myxococcales bacterium]